MKSCADKFAMHEDISVQELEINGGPIWRARNLFCKVLCLI